MTSFSREPEFWVEAAPGDDSGDWDGWNEPGVHDDRGGDDGDPPGGSTPPERPRRWVRWAAVGAGLVVIAGLIAWQNHGSNNPDLSEQTTIQTPLTEHASTAGTPATGGTGPLTTRTEVPGPTVSGTVDDPCTSSGTCRGGVLVQAIDPIPSFLAADPLPLPGAPFELIGLNWNGEFGSVATLLRYRSDTGAMVQTEVSAELSGPLALVPIPGAVIVKPWFGMAGGGLVVPDGERAAHGAGLLDNSGPAVLAADDRHVWVPSVDYRGTITFTSADPISGKASGQTIDLPPSVGDTDVSALQGVLTGDGAGYLLLRTVGGVYDLRPGTTQLVTHGEVLATGPTGYLVYECDKTAQCAVVVIDRATGDRATLSGYAPSAASVAGGLSGVMSPDGRYAALLDFAAHDGPPLGIMDLRADSVRPVMLPIAPLGDGDVTSMMAFTPDGSCLIVMSGDYVRAVDPATGAVLGDLPVPPKLRVITVRPLG